MQPLDNEARIGGIDAHRFREAALINSGFYFETKQRAVFQLHNFLAGKGFEAKVTAAFYSGLWKARSLIRNDEPDENAVLIGKGWWLSSGSPSSVTAPYGL
jgi:hypothetical protein